MDSITDREQMALASYGPTPVSVEFRTKRGTVRVMTCTRNLKNVPEEQRYGIKTPVLNQPGIVAVYDLMVFDWRAFRLDSIISYERLE